MNLSKSVSKGENTSACEGTDTFFGEFNDMSRGC
jgi:hypothetical protein